MGVTAHSLTLHKMPTYRCIHFHGTCVQSHHTSHQMWHVWTRVPEWQLQNHQSTYEVWDPSGTLCGCIWLIVWALAGIFYFSTWTSGKLCKNLRPTTKIVNIPTGETGFCKCTAPYEIHTPTRRVINTKRCKQTDVCSCGKYRRIISD